MMFGLIVNQPNAPVRRLSEPTPGKLFALLGVLLAMVVGALAADGHDRLTLTVALAVPIVVALSRYPWAAVLAWLAVSPFFVVDDGRAGIETWLLHRLLVPAALGASIAYRLLGVSRSRFRLSVIDAVLIVFVILAFANIAVLSDNPVRMAVAFYDRVIIPIGLYWLVRMLDPNEPDFRRLMWVMVWLVVVQFTVGALSWLAPGVLPDPWLGRAGERTVGTVGGPAQYTITLMLGALLILPHLLRERAERVVRIVLFAAMSIAFVGVAISFSRGSWLGAVLVLGGLAIAYRAFALRMAVATALVLGLVAVGPMSHEVAFAIERLGDEQTAASRLVTNNAAVLMIGERPLTGFGYGNFERYDEQFKVRIGDIAVQEGSAHHTYLALAAENGVPALALYLFPAVWLLWLTVSRWQRLTFGQPSNRALLIVLWLAVVDQFVVMNFMDMLHSSPWGTGLWWFSLGLIHVVITRGSAAPQPRPIGVDARRNVP